MACQWRIRHKLVLGLGFAVAVVALLLVGALKGLDSYRTTIKTIDSKLVDLKYTVELQGKVRDLAAANEGNNAASKVRKKIFETRAAVTAYETRLKELDKFGHRPDQKYRETAFVDFLHDYLTNLDAAVEKAVKEQRALDDAVPQLITKLSVGVGDRIGEINVECYERIGVAKDHARFSLTVVIATSAGGVLLMAGLLRFFYRWTFYPIRDLQAGVSRVGQGDFDHTIQIRSGDEIEDLAAAFNDMTRRLRDMYRDLERQVNERSRQLVRSERLAGVGFLAAGVAHEINNPLASVVFCSEALERRLSEILRRVAPGSDADVEVVAKYLRMIQQESLRCKEITQRLLEFSRGGERRREPTDLGELIQGVLDVAQHLQSRKGKTVAFDEPDGLVAAVNAQEIKQVVLNLVVNALDSMEDGGTLTITLGQCDGLAEMVFADTGCGMTDEVLENIFEPFFTRSRTGKGTGLGLSISHRIINGHRGEIEAVSGGPGHGSTFTVRLPLQSADQEPGSGEQDWSARRAA